jgi:phosphoribosyl 1,2-cyclic phosphate phosphodiesterase
MDYRDKRLRSSVHVEVDGLSLVVDTGPDFRQQVLRENITRLHAVLFTHAHKDHVAGLDDVRAFNFVQAMDMPVYADEISLNQIRTEFSYAFSPQRYPGIPQLQLQSIGHAPFHIKGTTITPLPVLHHQLPILGYRFGNFSYITDANNIPPETLELLKGTEVFVLNALQKEKHISHFNLSDALEVASLVGARKTFFTHISHKLGTHKAVSALLPDSVALAHDGLTISF